VLIDTKVKGEVVVDVVVKLDVKEGDVDVVIENVNVDVDVDAEVDVIKGDVDVVVVDKYISSFLMLFITTVIIHSKVQ
jgi:hypothetical protein